MATGVNDNPIVNFLEGAGRSAQGDSTLEDTRNELATAGRTAPNRPYDVAPIERPLQAFKAGVSSGAANVRAQNINFGAAIAPLMGNDIKAANRLAEGSRASAQAAIPLAGMEQFEDFLEEPTARGFFNQMAAATGQFIPSAAATVGEAAIGAAVVGGATLLTGGAAPAALLGTAGAGAAVLKQVPKKLVANRAVHSETKDYLQNIINIEYKNGIARNKKIDEPFPLSTKELNDLDNYIYPELRAQKMRKMQKRGAIAGAFGQEQRMGTGIAFSDYADQDMADRSNAITSLLQGSVFGVIGVGAEYTVARSFLGRLKAGRVNRKPLADDPFLLEKVKGPSFFKDAGVIAGTTAFS